MNFIKKTAFSLIAIILGFSIAFFIAELAIRIISPQTTGPTLYGFDPELGAIPIPKYQGRIVCPGFYDWTFSNNSLGLRGTKEYAFEKTAAHRVLLLGDSFTYGCEVNDDQTFAYHLEKRLSSLKGGVEVINAGAPAKGTDYELNFFKKLGYKFRPDLTILCFYANDFADNARGEFFNVDEEGGISPKKLRPKLAFITNLPLYNWLLSWSHIANLLRKAAQDFIIASVPSSDLIVQFSNSGGDFSDNNNIRLTRIYIEQLNKAVKSAGGKFIIFYITRYSEAQLYREKCTISGDEQAIMDITKDLGITFCSLTQIISNYKDNLEKLYYVTGNVGGHYTATTHSVVGEYMSSYIKPILEGKNTSAAP